MLCPALGSFARQLSQEIGASNQEIMAITDHATPQEVDRHTKTARKTGPAASAVGKQIVPLPPPPASGGAKEGSKPLKSIAQRGEMVPRGGIEPPTLRFSVACSTN
jgi:hypothetical protein